MSDSAAPQETAGSKTVSRILRQMIGRFKPTDCTRCVRVMIDGDMDAGAWSCGMVAGLIHDIPTCKELIDRIMSEADQIINERLAGFMKGTVNA